MFKERQDFFNEIATVLGARDYNGNMPDYLMNRRRSFDIQTISAAFILLHDINDVWLTIKYFGRG